jgi:5'(3')-deoxyribonucleotidase
MNKPIVFIDMDGVLANLDRGLFEMFGVEEPEGSRDRLFKEYLPAYTEAGMFYKQPVLGHAQELVRLLCMLHYTGEINIAICTSTGQFYRPVSEVRDQKSKWIETHFPDLVDIPFCTTTSGRDKSILAHPKAFLIDDHYKNVDRFIEAGGHACIYNYTDDPNDVIDAICKAFHLKFS